MSKFWPWGAIVLCVLAEVSGQSWREDTFEDFSDGILDASGQNLYVTRDGTIATIHRFDLNRDGFLDLVYNSNHDTVTVLPATVVSLKKERKLQRVDLPTQGVSQVVSNDLNHDGYPDLVFRPNSGGVQHPRRFVEIAWGGPRGWSGDRLQGLLPVYDVRSIEIADLNADGWPDIVTLNGEAWRPGQPEGQILRVYWGGPAGFLAHRWFDTGVPSGTELVSGDFDGDGYLDVVVLVSKNRVRAYWSTASGENAPLALRTSEMELPSNDASCLLASDLDRDGALDLIVGGEEKTFLLPGAEGPSWGDPVLLVDHGASHLAAGDLDADGFADLVSTFSPQEQEAVTRVFWGNDSGFSSDRSTIVPVGNTTASAIGDFDGDGCVDLAAAVLSTGETYDAQSQLLFGRCGRVFSAQTVPVSTRGASDVLLVSPDDSHQPYLIFCNSRGGMVEERVPLLIYLGGENGFEATRRWEIPFQSGYEATAADLNQDGFPELIAVNAGSFSESSPFLGANIFWGSREGTLDSNRRTTLREKGVGGSNVGDLNRDGYLDLVLTTYYLSEPKPIIIYYGSLSGFEKTDRQVLELEEFEADANLGWVSPPVVADFNKDGWLDIAVTSTHTDQIWIFWGSPEGFKAEKRDRLVAPGPYSAEAADLNSDGFLELIIGTFNRYRGDHHDTGTLIFWGDSKGFRPSNAQWLPGSWTAGLTIADFDGDGFLDIFCSHYHADLTREFLPSYLYWGSSEGFQPDQKSVFIAHSVHDAAAGDYDQDGLLDVAVSSHSDDGKHRVNSLVFLNDGDRFKDPTVTRLPTIGSHWMWGEDLGHIYHRKWSQRYNSSPFCWEDGRVSGTIRFKADIPFGARLSFSVRSGGNKEELREQGWQPVTKGAFALEVEDRCLQYEALFKSDNGDRYPVLDEVTITLSAASAP